MHSRKRFFGFVFMFVCQPTRRRASRSRSRSPRRKTRGRHLRPLDARVACSDGFSPRTRLLDGRRVINPGGHLCSVGAVSLTAREGTAYCSRMVISRRLALAALIALVVSSSSSRPSATLLAATDNGVTAGEFVVDPPTLINLGFEWFIEGDDNRNASVDVSYRKTGDTRLETRAAAAAAAGRAHHSRRSSSTSTSPNMFAGSILDLEPDTAYEARFVLSDPDGVSGEKREDGHGEDAARADAGGRRPRLPRLSARVSRARRSSRRSKG